MDISQDNLRRMVPGMVGAVNYGSGKKAYDPMQTVAGKTGTCIQQGAWVGLFTSYAPLANPRLAVVVIARGSDGRKHFPAAVAGRIYRDLNQRFGTPIHLQLAAKPGSDSKAAELNEEEKDAVEAEAAETDAAIQAEEQKAAATAATAPPNTASVGQSNFACQQHGKASAFACRTTQQSDSESRGTEIYLRQDVRYAFDTTRQQAA